MKKMLKALFILFAFAFLVAGCKSSDDDDSSIAAPGMGTADDIPASGATSSPATESEATALYTAATAALSSSVVSASASVRSARAITRAAPRATRSEYEDLSGSYTIGTGTVTLTGGYTVTATVPDEGWQAEPNKTYNDLYSMTVSGDVTGTLDKATAASGTYTYTISGKLVNRENVTFNMDLVTGASSASANLDYALGIGLGYAITIVRNDGVGAKYIVSYAANYADDDIALDDTGSSNEQYQTELENYLLSQPVTLSVYNDSNTLLYTAKLDANAAFEDALF